MERLINKTSELKNYEKKFNLLKNIQIPNVKNNLFNFDINYMMDDYLLNFNVNKIKNTKENIDKLLRHELEMNFDIKINNISELQNKINYFFNRYNFIIKNIIEDNWILHKKNLQTKYELKDSEFVYDNSILIKNKEQANLIYFLKKMYKLCNIMAKQINYKVYTKFYDDEYHEICWLIFVFAKN
jgi:hypothetical protein